MSNAGSAGWAAGAAAGGADGGTMAVSAGTGSGAGFADAAFGAAVATRAGVERVVVAGRDAARVAVVLVARVEVRWVADGVASGATFVSGVVLVSVAGAGASGSGVAGAGVPDEVSGTGVCCAIKGVVEMARTAAIAVVVRRMLVCVWVMSIKPLPQRYRPSVSDEPTRWADEKRKGRLPP